MVWRAFAVPFDLSIASPHISDHNDLAFFAAPRTELIPPETCPVYTGYSTDELAGRRPQHIRKTVLMTMDPEPTQPRFRSASVRALTIRLILIILIRPGYVNMMLKRGAAAPPLVVDPNTKQKVLLVSSLEGDLNHLC